MKPRSRPCPLCSESFDEENDLFVHLLVSHRKSEIVRALPTPAALAAPVAVAAPWLFDLPAVLG